MDEIIGVPPGLAVLARMSTSSAAPQITTYLTPEEVGYALKISTDTVARHFGRMEGVIDLGTPETLHKRRKRVLRIPKHVLDAYIEERQVTVRRRR